MSLRFARMRDDNDNTSNSEKDESRTDDDYNYSEDSDSTDSESTELDSIDKIFYEYTSLSEFCVGGKVELNETASKLFYKCPDGTSRFIDFLNPSEEDINMLINSCNESPFGLGRQSVIDASVRQAKELRANDFSHQFIPQLNSSMTSQIKKFLDGRDFVIKPYKLNIYLEGGHFKQHKDTIKNDKMIASLVMCLPIPFEGGTLTVKNEKGQTGDFDWGKEVSLSVAKTNVIHWACFFCSCDHYISKVTKGKRITITFDILTADDQQEYSDDVSAVIPELFRDKCREKLLNYVKKLDVNKVYGYFPNHIYRFSDTEGDEQNDLRDKLKGNDVLLYDILNQEGWKIVLKVYYPDLNSFGPSVPFAVDYADDELYMKDAIGTREKKKLSKLSTLNLLNKNLRSRRAKIHDYDYYYGYTGNSPIRERKFFYAGTVMVLRSQTSEATAESTQKCEPV